MPEKSCSLLDKTRELLNKRISETSLIEVHVETQLPFYWLRKIAQGETRDPSVRRVQELYEKLSGKKLEV